MNNFTLTNISVKSKNSLSSVLLLLLFIMLPVVYHINIENVYTTFDISLVHVMQNSLPILYDVIFIHFNALTYYIFYGPRLLCIIIIIIHPLMNGGRACMHYYKLVCALCAYIPICDMNVLEFYGPTVYYYCRCSVYLTFCTIYNISYEI